MRDCFNEDLTMSTRKNGKLKRIIALVVNLQLVLTTSAFAQNEKRDDFFLGVAKATNAVTGLAGSAMQGMQQMQMQQQQQYTANMVRGSMKLQFINPAQTPPMLLEGQCAVLDAIPVMPADQCKDLDPMKAQSGYYAAVVEAAEDNINDVQKYLTPGHEKYTTQGVGCYEKALKAFQAKLNSRLEAINKLEEGIEREFEAFTALTKQEIEGVKNLNAELTGKPAERAKDKKWDKEFSDPQCASFVTGDKFKSTGKSGGYESIKNLLSKTAENPGKGALSASNLKAQQKAIKREVRQIAKAVAKHVKKKKIIEGVDPSTIGVRSKYIGTKNAAVLSIISSSSTKAKSDLEDLQKETLKGVEDGDGEAKTIISGIMNDTVDLDNALFNYERSKKNNCFNNYLKNNFGGSAGLASKLQDPNISKKANKESDSAFKNSISSILMDDEYTMEEKLNMIKKEEKKSGNGRYSFTTGKSVNIKGKQIGASTRLRASDMLSIFSDNCSERFEKLRNKKGKSPRTVLNSLKGFKSKFKKIQNEYATKLADNIISGMLECPEDKTTGSGAGSCSGESLNTKSDSFCLRTANVCAGNMLACKDRAEQVFDQKRNEQKNLAKSYNNKMKAFKGKLVSAFQNTNKILEATSRQLDGMYQMGSVYNAPVGLDLNMLKDQFMTKDGVDASLMMEDPAKYKDLMKKNIAALKKSIKKANDEILNGPKNDENTVIASAGDASKFQGVSGEIKKYLANYDNQMNAYKELAASCRGMITAFNAQQAKENEKIAEQNAERRTMCNKVMAFNENPAGFCGSASELGDEVLKIAAVAGDRKAAADLKAFGETCDSYGSEDGSNMYDHNYSGGTRNYARKTASEFCSESGNKDIQACDRYNAVTKKYSKGSCGQSTTLDDLITNDDLVGLVVTTKEGYSGKVKEKANLPASITEQDYVPFDKTDSKHMNAYKDQYAESIMDSNDCFILDELPEREQTRISDAEDAVSGYIAQEQRSKMYASVGDVNISQCGSMYGGDVGKEFFNQAGQMMGRGLAGGGVMPAAGLSR